MKGLRILYDLTIAMMLMSMITACSSGDDTPEVEEGDAHIRLRLSTRSLSDDESNINTVSAATFGSDGKLLNFEEYAFNSSVAHTITASINATELIVVANAHSGIFSGVTTKSEFMQALSDNQSLAYTTSTAGDNAANASTAYSQKATALPMIADTVFAESLQGKSSVNATLRLTRLVAKVQLSLIRVNLQANGIYPDAKFLPEEVFLYDVHDHYPLPLSSLTSVSGEYAEGSATNYLGTGDLNYTLGADKDYLSSSDTPIVFYVFPHGDSDPTRLVIKGTFYETSSSAGETVYYPVVINKLRYGSTITKGSTTYIYGNSYSNDSQIAANGFYSIRVAIGVKGANSPEGDVEKGVTVNTTVTDWATSTLDAEFLPPLVVYDINEWTGGGYDTTI
jgi:hypothetical protein